MKSIWRVFANPGEIPAAVSAGFLFDGRILFFLREYLERGFFLEKEDFSLELCDFRIGRCHDEILGPLRD